MVVMAVSLGEQVFGWLALDYVTPLWYTYCINLLDHLRR